MPESLSEVAETTSLTSGTDALSEPLRSLRVRSGLLLREDYAPPWGIRIPAADALARLLDAGQDVTVAAFHLVEAGEVELRHPGMAPIRLIPGELAVVFGGTAHELGGGVPTEVVSVETLLANGPRVHRRTAPSPAGSAALICGVFFLQNTMLNPLLAALPPVLTCQVGRSGEFDHLAGVARLLAREIDASAPGGGFIVERLLEVLCAEAIRSQLAAGARHDPGLLAAVQDPVVAPALALLHEQPGRGWSVQMLAGEVGMSPSRFAARFCAAVGMPVMAYLTRWRMHLACQTLTDTDTGVDQIARGLGYGSTAAFHRAFRRTVGVSPGAWRKDAA